MKWGFVGMGCPQDPISAFRCGEMAHNIARQVLSCYNQAVNDVDHRDRRRFLPGVYISFVVVE
jgi:hypothetical protein